MAARRIVTDAVADEIVHGPAQQGLISVHIYFFQMIRYIQCYFTMFP